MLLVVGITGASGSIFGIRLLEVLAANKEVETHLIISEAGEKNIKYETDWKLEDVRALADFCYDIDNNGARLASGSSAWMPLTSASTSASPSVAMRRCKVTANGSPGASKQ